MKNQYRVFHSLLKWRKSRNGCCKFTKKCIAMMYDFWKEMTYVWHKSDRKNCKFTVCDSSEFWTRYKIFLISLRFLKINLACVVLTVFYGSSLDKSTETVNWLSTLVLDAKWYMLGDAFWLFSHLLSKVVNNYMVKLLKSNPYNGLRTYIRLKW